MYKSIALLLAASVAVQATSAFPPVRRQLVELSCTESGLKDCGTGCIELSYTCCPSLSAGCPIGNYCTSVGCCPIGEVCVGGGGVITEPGETLTSTQTIDIPEESSVPDVETSTSETSVTLTATSTKTTPAYKTSTSTPTTNATSSYPPATEPTEFPGAADKTQVFSAFNLLAFVLPFLFA